MNTEVFFSAEKVKGYLKKYWWILGICVLAGAVCFGISVWGNKTVQEQRISYDQKVFPVIIDDEKAVSISLISGNCKTLLGIEDVQDEINNYLKNQGDDIISDWATVETSTVEDSLFFAIKIKQKEKIAERQTQAIVAVLNDYLIKYKQNVELVKVGGLQQNKETVISGQSIYLKDVLILFGSFAIGLFIIYLFMLFGKRVSDPYNLEVLLQPGNILLIDKKRTFLISEWIGSLETNESTLFLMGKGTEEIERVICSLKNENYSMVAFDQYGECLRKKEFSKKYLIVHSMKDYLYDIENIVKINKMYHTSVDGCVYIKA